jgi:ankyrin repeat protein
MASSSIELNDFIFRAALFNDKPQLIRELKKTPHLIDTPNKKGETPLFIAAKNGSWKVLKTLLKLGSTAINTKNHSGQTPLRIALIHRNIDVTFILLKAGCCVTNEADEFEWTDMAYAIFTGFPRIVELLIQHNYPVTNELQSNGRTLLHHAAESRKVEILDLLIRAGLNCIDTPSNYGSTPMVCASDQDAPEMIEKLIELGCTTINTPTSDGCTPMALAVSGGMIRNVRVFMRYGIEIPKVIGEHEKTPFHYAVYAGPTFTKELMLLGCTNFETPNKHGETPLQKAYANNVHSMIEFFMALHGYSWYINVITKEEKIEEIRYDAYFSPSLVLRLLTDLDVHSHPTCTTKRIH